MDLIGHVIDGEERRVGRRGDVRLDRPVHPGALGRGRAGRRRRGRPRRHRRATRVRRGPVAADGLRRARRAAPPARRPDRRARRRAGAWPTRATWASRSSDAQGKDVPRTAQNFRFFADHARLAMAETLPMDTGHHAYTRYEPAGVVAAIAPWNFPLMLESWKVAPALAWGNTVVLKPAEDTPASATILARLALEAGIPPGVLNVLHGYGPDSAGSALTEDRGVDRITFTGESGTGRHHHRRRGEEPHARSASSWAARAPTSCSPTPTWTTPSTGRSRRSSPTRARSASPARGCTSQRAIFDEFLARVRRRGRGAGARRPEGRRHPARARSPRRSTTRRSAATSRTRAGRGLLTGGLGDGLGREADRRRRRPRRLADPVRGGVRPGRHRHPVRLRGRGRPRSPTTRRTGSTRWCSPRTCRGRTGSPRRCGRHDLGQLLLHPRPARPLRRLRRLRRGTRGRHASAASSSPSPRPS